MSGDEGGKYDDDDEKDRHIVTFGYNFSSLKNIFQTLTVEPIAFLIVFSNGLSSSVIPSLIMDRVCRVDLEKNDSTCQNISNFKDVENEVQRIADNILIYNSLLEFCPSLFLALLAGPWSDENGRKAILVIPLLFFSLSQFVLLLFHLCSKVSAYAFLGASINGWGGGISSLLIGLFSYVTDTSSLSSRTSRIAFLNIVLLLSFPLGSFFSGLLISSFGLLPIFSLSTTLPLLSSLYVVFLLPESLNLSPRRSVFSFTTPIVSYILSPFKISFRKRRDNLQIVVISLLCALSIKVIASGVNIYMYTNKMLNWNVRENANFMGFTIILGGLGSYGFLPLFQKYFSDSYICILSQIFEISGRLLQAYSKSSEMMYGSIFLSMFGVLGNFISRSLLSKVIPKEDTGKIFGALGGLEALCSVISTFAMNFIYNQTLDIFPGYQFLFSAFLGFLTLVLFALIHHHLSQSRIMSYEYFLNEDLSTNEENTPILL